MRSLLLYALLCLLGTGCWAAPVSELLNRAKPGTVVQLPAGTFPVKELVIPPGVSLKGAGYEQTILDATGAKNGVIITDNSGVTLSDLTIRGALESGVILRKSKNVTVRNVKLSGNLTGLLLDTVTGGRVENAIIINNRTGFSLSHATDSVLVNCTVANNSAIAASITHADHVAVFNNLFINSPTGIFCGSTNKRFSLDANLYIANFIGKMEGETTRATLAAWQALSGFDRHSVVLPIRFTDSTKENYHPVSSLEWAPVNATSSNWGLTKLGDFTAPKHDIDGNSRIKNPDLGVYETILMTQPTTGAETIRTAAWKPDGQFTVKDGLGVTSAGLYTKDGTQVALLFQNLPLSAGVYPFELPHRDFQGQPIPDGDYELRVVESKLSTQYLGLAGSYGLSSDMKDSNSWAESMYTFDDKDRVYVGQGWNENHHGLRAFDTEYKTVRWMMLGDDRPTGMVAEGAYLYVMTNIMSKPDTSLLRRFDQESGNIVPFTDGASQLSYTKFKNGNGMTVLDGTLFFADTAANKLYYTTLTDLTFATAFDIPTPSSVTADKKNHLLWLISGEKLLALEPETGAVKYNASPVKGPRVVSVNNGRMAVLSPITGKVHLFDCSNPAQLIPLRTIGSGDGPYGAITPDRFWFQQASNRPREPKMWVALNSKGEAMVVDSTRISFWTADGTLKRQGMGFWGQHLLYGKFAGDTDVRFWGNNGDYSMKMDGKNNRWQPDTYWQLPVLNYDGRSPMGFFTAQGRNFGAYYVKGLGADTKTYGMGFAFVEFTGFVGTARSLYMLAPGQGLMMVHDSNQDGVINDKDTAVPVLNAAGVPMKGIPGSRYYTLDQQGNISLPGDHGNASMGTVIRFAGFDAQGNPIYDWAHPANIPGMVKKRYHADITV